jgi:energy-coupling factor transporter ATP-binding protein EcfA2
VKITVKNYRCFADSHPVRIDLSRESIGLVGENNTGKSALLRLLFELRPTFSHFATPANLIWGAAVPGHAGLQTQGVDASNIFCLANTRPLSIEIDDIDLPDGAGAATPNGVMITAERERHVMTATLRRNGVTLPVTSLDYPRAGVVTNPREPTVTLLAPLSAAFAELVRAKYIGADRNLISQTQGPYYDIQMGTELVLTWNNWKFGNIRSQELRCRTLEERIRGAFGLSRFEIRTNAGRTMLQVLVDDQTYLLNEVGTGLAQYILVGANLLIGPCSYALIDEPESNLHPGIQGDFLEMIEEYTEKCVIFASHSLGLASTFASDAYQTERLADGTTRLRPLDRNSFRSPSMRALLYSGFIDVGADIVVFVEGPHDVNVIRAFLRILGKRHSGAVLPVYGDSTIAHRPGEYLDELIKVIPASHLMYIIDSERDAKGSPVAPEREAFRLECERRAVRCLLTERRAIENYLTERAIKKVKGDSHRALAPYELLDKSASDLWGKAENGLIAAEMTVDEILATDLGRYLNNNVSCSEPREPTGDAGNVGN